VNKRVFIGFLIYRYKSFISLNITIDLFRLWRLICLAFLLAGFDSALGGHRTVLEAIRSVPSFHDMAVVREAVQQGRRPRGISEYTGPLRKAEVGRDDDIGVFVQLDSRWNSSAPST